MNAPPLDAAFRRDVVAGLAGVPRAIPGKHLWDDAGAILFDRVCEGADYYVTRRETALLEAHAAEIAAEARPGASLVEFGSGASRKVRLLLDALAAPRRYVAVDIAPVMLADAAARIGADYPGLEVIAVAGDYMGALALPDAGEGGNVLGFFPGNTIGSYERPVLMDLLARLRATLGPGSRFLLGVDANRDRARLARAYADPEGRMAAFHLHLLDRMADELAAGLRREDFRHEVRISDDARRVEALLVATRPTEIRIDGRRFAFAAGDSVRTDNSFKHPPAAFAAIAAEAGFRPARHWLDADEVFSLHLLEA